MVVIVIIVGIIGAIVIALAIFTFVYLFVFQPNQIKGESMVPTYPNNAYVLTNKLTYRAGLPQRGDVVIFKYPQNTDFEYVERIIGLPGEQLQILNGKVYINSNELEEPYIYTVDSTQTFIDGFITEGEVITIPQNNYFVMGDNREHSLDSRLWGYVPNENIIGKVTLCYSSCK